MIFLAVSAGRVHRSAQVDLDVAAGALVEDVAGIGQQPSQAIELDDHQGYPPPDKPPAPRAAPAAFLSGTP